jgi:hypothetical protein
MEDNYFGEYFILKVVDINNNVYHISCFGNDHSIEYIKRVLSWQTKISSHNIILLLNNIELINYKLLKDYNIDKDSIIKMLFKLKSGFIK